MEPERRIEKLLRAFAKKRREQAGDPMELHPVARQQLQKEIARRAAGTRGGASFWSFFLRPRLAFAISFAVLAVAGLILLPNLNGPKPSTLASSTASRDKMVPAEKTAPALQPPVSTVAPLADAVDRPTFDYKQQTVSGDLAKKPAPVELTGANRQQAAASTEVPKQAAAFENTIAQANAPAAVPVAPATPSNKEQFAFKADEAPAASAFGGAAALGKDVGGQTVASAPPPTPVTGVMPTGTTLAANEERQKKLKVQTESVSPAIASVAYFDRSKSEGAAVIPPVSQVFNRSDILGTRRRTTDALSGSSPVLLSFRVEQAGNAMRVVDADGSVYTGAVQLAPQAGTTRTLAPKNVPPAPPAAKAAVPSQAAQNYFFRVAGTNRNLKQNVVFSGNLIPLTNAEFGLNGAGRGGAPGAQGAVDARTTELQLSNSRISGTAVIGDQKEFEVIATPAP